MKEKKYKITMNEKQMQLMSEALEFHSRFCAGQLDHFPPALQKYMWNSKEFQYRDSRYLDLLYELKRIIWDLEPNASHGIGWEEIPEMNLGYEMYKMIEYYKVNRRIKDGENLDYNVHSSQPIKYTHEPLIKIEEIK